MSEPASAGYRTFYSRPPLFLIVTASTPDQLAAKVAELDAKFKALEMDKGGNA